MIDIYGNTITITVSGDNNTQIYTRAHDGIVINYPTNMGKSTTDALALGSFNAMAPHDQYVPPTFIDVIGFELALYADPGATSSLKQNVAPLLSFLNQCIAAGNITLLKQQWAAFVATPPAWFTTAIKNAILGYAATYNIPIP